MKKVGILTFHKGMNYGGFYQVLSLKRCLESLGHAVQVIDYRSKGFGERELEFFFNRVHNSRLVRLKNYIKLRRFAKAHRQLDLTYDMNRPEELVHMEFDAVVFGSDEVWNFASPFIGYDPSYFGANLKAERLISYAVSIGNVKPEQRPPDELVKLVSRFQALSVRDENTQAYCGRYFEKTPEIVADPTFLIDHYEEPVEVDPKMLVVYGHHFHPDCREAIQKLAKDAGLQTHSISYDNAWCDRSEMTLSVEDWRRRMKQAALIVTNMYHGILFSLHARRPFLFYSTEHRRMKLGKLPERLGFEQVIVDEEQYGSPLELERAKLDYEGIGKRAAEFREHSRAYLEQALA